MRLEREKRLEHVCLSCQNLHFARLVTIIVLHVAVWSTGHKPVLSAQAETLDEHYGCELEYRLVISYSFLIPVFVVLYFCIVLFALLGGHPLRVEGVVLALQHPYFPYWFLLVAPCMT